jgi:hypothetical protein
MQISLEKRMVYLAVLDAMFDRLHSVNDEDKFNKLQQIADEYGEIMEYYCFDMASEERVLIATCKMIME